MVVIYFFFLGEGLAEKLNSILSPLQNTDKKNRGENGREREKMRAVAVPPLLLLF